MMEVKKQPWIQATRRCLQEPLASHWALGAPSLAPAHEQPAAPTMGLTLAKESWLRSWRATPSCSHLPGRRHRADKSSVTHHKTIEFLRFCPTPGTRLSCSSMQEKTLYFSPEPRGTSCDGQKSTEKGRGSWAGMSWALWGQAGWVSQGLCIQKFKPVAKCSSFASFESSFSRF